MAGQEQVLADTRIFQMNYVGGDTYSYSFLVDKSGNITVNVIKYTQGGVYAEYYPNTSLTGDNEHQNITDDLINDWHTNIVFGSYDNQLGAKYYFRLKPPVSGNYDFSMNVDDTGKFILDGNTVMYQHRHGDTSGSMTLDANRYYYGLFEWTEGRNRADFHVYWKPPGRANETIPSTAFYYPEYMFNSAVTVG